MSKKYDERLVQAIKEKQYTKKINGIDVLIKPIPDCDIPGAMDPRVYEDTKGMARMMRLMPKGLMKMDASPKSIQRLRKMFNGVKSEDIASPEIETKILSIKGLDNNDIPIYAYLPLDKSKPVSVLYYIHGGGFFGGHHGVVEQLLKMIVEKFNVLVFSIDYRLAPENPYPKGHEDCFEGLKWVYENASDYGGDPKNIFVSGDSAGGNLTQYCTTRDLEEGSHMVKGQMLLYPTVNMAGIKDGVADWNIDKYEIYDKHKKVLLTTLSMMNGDDGLSGLLDEILGTSDVDNKYLTPYGMDMSGLPPTMMSVGQHDFLYVECLAYAKKLVDAGVDTTTIVYNGMGHAYGDNIGVYPQSEDCADEMGNFIRAHESL